MAGLLKIGGLVLVLLIAQVGIFWYFFSGGMSGSGTTKEAAQEKVVPEKAAAEIADTGSDNAEFTEVNVSPLAFRCTNGKAAAGGGVVHVDFKLVALVPTPQATKFQDKLKLHEARIRQAVAAVARSLTLDDLNDPNLAMMKRRIREEINKDLAGNFVHDIVIIDYTTMEQ